MHPLHGGGWESCRSTCIALVVGHRVGHESSAEHDTTSLTLRTCPLEARRWKVYGRERDGEHMSCRLNGCTSLSIIAPRRTQYA